MEHDPPPLPAESSFRKGIAYQLWLPERSDPAPAVMILHGAGSQKENHADFARAALGQGFVTLTFDNRGHGETEGELGPGVLDDMRHLVRFIAARPEVDARRIAVRGSSMGGLLAIHSAAVADEIAAVVAICPAAEWMLLEDVKRIADGEPPKPGSYLAAMRIDAPALVTWLERNDVGEAVERLDGKPLLLIHARSDETIPYTHSQQLYERASEPKRLLLLEGGDHRSAQHDPEIQRESLRWLAHATGNGNGGRARRPS